MKKAEANETRLTTLRRNSCLKRRIAGEAGEEVRETCCLITGVCWNQEKAAVKKCKQASESISLTLRDNSNFLQRQSFQVHSFSHVVVPKSSKKFCKLNKVQNLRAQEKQFRKVQRVQATSTGGKGGWVFASKPLSCHTDSYPEWCAAGFGHLHKFAQPRSQWMLCLCNFDSFLQAQPGLGPGLVVRWVTNILTIRKWQQTALQLPCISTQWLFIIRAQWSPGYWHNRSFHWYFCSSVSHAALVTVVPVFCSCLQLLVNNSYVLVRHQKQFSPLHIKKSQCPPTRHFFFTAETLLRHVWTSQERSQERRTP